jgi:putative protease
VGCRNTVFGAQAQEASRHLAAWQAAGIYHFRLEFVHETGEQVAMITRAFADTLQHKQSITQLNRDLAKLAPQGSTEGSLFIAEDYLEIPLLQ